MNKKQAKKVNKVNAKQKSSRLEEWHDRKFEHHTSGLIWTLHGCQMEVKCFIFGKSIIWQESKQKKKIRRKEVNWCGRFSNYGINGVKRIEKD